MLAEPLYGCWEGNMSHAVERRPIDIYRDRGEEKVVIGNAGVSIFIDFIGLPVFRATLKTLARPGVITTAGWKEGMNPSTVRAIDCINWHTHVHTHYARYAEGAEAVEFAEKNDWMPPADDSVYGWDEIPTLAREYAFGSIVSYFPLFQINPA